MNLSDTHVAEIIEVGRRLYQKGLLCGTNGNLSVRLDAQRILITGAGASKGRMTWRDLVVLDLAGKKLDGQPEPSSEVRMHLFAYRQRPDVVACVHTHPPYATAFAVAGQELTPDALPEMVALLGQVPLTSYAPPGTDAVPESLAPFLSGHDAFLLRNHGVLTVGRSLDEAANRMEMVEHCAQILYLAIAIGGPQRMPRDDFERLKTAHDSRLAGHGRNLK